MDIFLYIILFMMGATFGSFFSLAVYRIPLHQDITHKRSYCPNCQHRLSVLDTIPIISYLALGAKCRYCNEPIRPRYLILEICSGLLFMLLGISMNFDFLKLNVSSLAYLGFSILYFCAVIIIAGIDKERKTINKGVLLYGTIVSVIYMIYLYIVEKINVYRYVIYLISMIIFLIANILNLKKQAKVTYVLDILMLCMMFAIFGTEGMFILTAILSLLAIAGYILIYNIKNLLNKCKKVDRNYADNLPIGFIMCVSNIVSIILVNFIIMY